LPSYAHERRHGAAFDDTDNQSGPGTDRIGPIVEPFQEAFKQVRDRFTAIPGLRRKGHA